MPKDLPTPQWPEFMRAELLARYLDVSPRQVWKLAASGQLPKPVRLGGNTRWRRADVDAALARATPGEQ